MNITADSFDPVPYTPPMLRGNKTEVVFLYRCGSESARRFSAAFAEYIQRETVTGQLKSIQAQRERFAAALEGHQGGTDAAEDVIKALTDRVAKLDEQLAEVEKSYPDITPIADDTDEEDSRIALLDIALVAVRIGSTTHTWPTLHDEKRRLLREVFAPKTIVELLQGINAQAYNEADAGKY